MDDLISRQAAIDYFQRINDATNTDSRYNIGFVDGLEFCLNHLSTMPSAQPERKKGKWIKVKWNDVNPLTGRRGVYVGCSECGCPIPTDSQLDFIDKSEALFCYQCGADMREEKNNAEIH